MRIILTVADGERKDVHSWASYIPKHADSVQLDVSAQDGRKQAQAEFQLVSIKVETDKDVLTEFRKLAALSFCLQTDLSYVADAMLFFEANAMLLAQQLPTSVHTHCAACVADQKDLGKLATAIEAVCTHFGFVK